LRHHPAILAFFRSWERQNWLRVPGIKNCIDPRAEFGVRFYRRITDGWWGRYSPGGCQKAVWSKSGQDGWPGCYPIAVCRSDGHIREGLDRRIGIVVMTVVPWWRASLAVQSVSLTQQLGQPGLQRPKCGTYWRLRFRGGNPIGRVVKIEQKLCGTRRPKRGCRISAASTNSPFWTRHVLDDHRLCTGRNLTHMTRIGFNAA